MLGCVTIRMLCHVMRCLTSLCIKGFATTNRPLSTGILQSRFMVFVVIFHVYESFRTCFAWKRLTKANMRRYTRQHPGRRALLVPLINRGSIARFVPLSVYIGFLLFAPPETRPGSYFVHCLEGKWGVFPLGEPSCRRPVLPVPARPLRPAVSRPVQSRPRYVRVLDSTGRNCR